MRRVVVLIAVAVVAAGAAAAVLALGGPRAVAHASLTRSLHQLVSRTPRRVLGAPTVPSVPQTGGTTCFVVGDGNCSLTPCVEFVAGTSCPSQPGLRRSSTQPALAHPLVAVAR